ncbi:glutamate 5-kinase [Ferruginibacter sp. HRS2-29]|uniref:glutamate 5-kinase n=1 Tax=Ferruginibacter sp. HRS2-29 TaxID=2487334 RepID=UPI0020CBBA8E|nr:glutamate 5-kinase [Ferruginibacter sp. HRS2-29]MCP9752580.1 glutamate 5-kinase [Ferruginibacter sp. HRS2-29]
MKKTLVIKLGTATITDNVGKISTSTIRKLAEEISLLSKTYNIVLVSSGAVGSGRSAFKNYQGTLTERKAAAAVGNPVLIRLYHKYFFKYGITVAQALCERHHFSNRGQFLQLKQTFEEFWRNDILPVVNENDLVSNVELKFSDNDELATLIAVGFDADTLIICTTVGGLKDHDKNIIPKVEKIDASVMGFVTKEKTSTGLGGMLSKLSSAKLAVSLGIKVIICGLRGAMPLTTALKGKAGTQFVPKQANLKARQKWLASGSITPGNITVDNGAAKALQNRKSLLSIGIKNIQGNFISGEAVQLVNESGEVIGVAKTKMSSAELEKQLAAKNIIAAHADDIVLFL